MIETHASLLAGRYGHVGVGRRSRQYALVGYAFHEPINVTATMLLLLCQGIGLRNVSDVELRYIAIEKKIEQRRIRSGRSSAERQRRQEPPSRSCCSL